MSVRLNHLERAESPEIATTIRNAGIAGAGGAGFPAYAKWERLDETPFLLVNHQESEPNYYIDKYLGKTHAEEFADLFDALLENAFELVVLCAKAKDREAWMGPFEEAADVTVYMPENLPLEPTEESGIVVAYSEDRYEYGMESVLMRIVADVPMRDELPMDHGWIVQNTETMLNLYRTLDEGDAMTRKFVHVDGNVPKHRFFDVPVGTPASVLLREAGRPPGELDDDEMLADGGPGWCFEIDADPSEFGVTKRTNCVLVLDEDVVAENILGDDRINVLGTGEWADRDHETTPSRLDPDIVRVPLITNNSLQGVVARSRPIVDEGEDVSAGEMIAVPRGEEISNVQYATMDGTVSTVTSRYVEITGERGKEAARGRELDHGRMVYWTWCDECGAYVARPEQEYLGENASYLCRDCR